MQWFPIPFLATPHYAHFCAFSRVEHLIQLANCINKLLMYWVRCVECTVVHLQEVTKRAL